MDLRTQDGNLPAGTGTVTVCLFLVWPEPLHRAQGVFMMDPFPPQRRHVERIMKGPVLIDSCKGRHRQADECSQVLRGACCRGSVGNSPSLCHCSSDSETSLSPARCPSRHTSGTCRQCSHSAPYSRPLPPPKT